MRPITLDEYRRLTETFGWRAEHFRHCNVRAARACFAPESVKDELARRIETDVGRDGGVAPASLG